MAVVGTGVVPRAEARTAQALRSAPNKCEAHVRIKQGDAEADARTAASAVPSQFAP
jgi:hypothetical protein